MFMINKNRNNFIQYKLKLDYNCEDRIFSWENAYIAK